MCLRRRLCTRPVSAPGDAPHVLHVQVIHLEKALGYFWEQRIQQFFLYWPDFVRFWNVYYWVAHGSNTIGALLALFFLRPAIYQVCSQDPACWRSRLLRGSHQPCCTTARTQLDVSRVDH